MKPRVWPSWEAFHAASEARREDIHDPRKASALVEARDRFEAALGEVLERVPYRVRKVGELRPARGRERVHLAVTDTVSIGDWRRPGRQTLCGAAPGRYAGDRPVTCTACLRLLDRHVDLEPNPPELPLV